MTLVSIAPTEDQALAVLRSFLLTLLPANTPVIRLQTNRVPEPKSRDWVSIQPILRTRLSTNVDATFDCAFEGSISGTELDVTSIVIGEITTGPLFGVDVASGSQITSVGPLGTGPYVVSPSQYIGSQLLAAGRLMATAQTELVVQIDVHGPASADNAQILTTVLWDDYAFQNLAGTGVAPLWASDPRELVFVNDQSQMERRWSIDAHVQVGPVVTLPQQFADQVAAGLINVDVVYPP